MKCVVLGVVIFCILGDLRMGWLEICKYVVREELRI